MILQDRDIPLGSAPTLFASCDVWQELSREGQVEAKTGHRDRVPPDVAGAPRMPGTGVGNFFVKPSVR
jgi:hypothetical protein